jgi:hypothetical protein
MARAEGFVLTGLVLLSDRGDGIAYLLEPSLTKGQVVAVRRGDSIGPYRLTRILDDRVELEGPSGTVVVPVRGGATAVAGGSAASPSRPAAGVHTEPAPAATDRTRQTSVGPGRASRSGRVPFETALRDRVRALRKNAEERNASEQDVEKKGAGLGRANASAAGAQPHVQGQGTPASATLTSIIQPQVAPSNETPSVNSLLGPLLGPR